MATTFRPPTDGGWGSGEHFGVGLLLPAFASPGKNQITRREIQVAHHQATRYKSMRDGRATAASVQ